VIREFVERGHYKRTIGAAVGDHHSTVADWRNGVRAPSAAQFGAAEAAGGAAAMTCTAVVLTAALAGLPPGTCTLQCEIRGAIIAHGDHGRGIASTEPGIWFTVHRVDGMMMLEQEPRQCKGRP
jgi:hypothetical protein